MKREKLFDLPMETLLAMNKAINDDPANFEQIPGSEIMRLNKKAWKKSDDIAWAIHHILAEKKRNATQLP